MVAATKFTTIVNQDESCDVEATFVDMDGNAIDGAAILSLTATLEYIDPEGTSTIINGRSDQSILNTNGGTVDAGGELTLRLQAADNPIINTSGSGSNETHILSLEWTYSDGVLTRTGGHEYQILVRRAGGGAGTSLDQDWVQ